MNRKILVVDDEPAIRGTLNDILTDSGFDVSTAPDGMTAVQMCEEQDYDVVLMDVRMPGIDGVEAFRRIRKTTDDIQVILMSAFGEDEVKHQALSDGAVAFLDKPLDLETVIRLATDTADHSILAVSDDDQFLSLLESNWSREKRGKLTIIKGAAEALEVARQIRFDVALIDVELPFSNGLDFYVQLRESNSTITAIMVCNADAKLMELANEAVQRTAYTVLTKPIRANTLADLINVLKRQKFSGVIRKPGSQGLDSD